MTVIQEIRDNLGRVIGKISQDNSDRQSARDSKGILVGTYSRREDKTRDTRSHIIGTGNLLSALIYEKR